MSRSAQGFAKVKDIHPGRVLYQVFCNSETASDIITTLIITGKPKLSGIVTNSYFFDCKEYNTRNNYSSIWLKHNYSITDRNVGVHDSDSYNLHHLFTSKKAAQKFIDRVNKGCLSFHEQKLLTQLAEYAEENDYWDALYGDPDDWEDVHEGALNSGFHESVQTDPIDETYALNGE